MENLSAGCPIIPDSIWEFPIGDSLVVARADVQGLFLLNASARVIWRFLRSELRRDELIARFSSHFGIPLELAADDVEATLRDWCAGLLASERNTLEPVVLSLPSLGTVGSFSQDYLLNSSRFRLVLEDEDLVDEITPRLKVLETHSGPPDVTFCLARQTDSIAIFKGADCIGVEETVTAARAVLLQEMVRVSGTGRDWLTILHAGAYGTPSHCILLAAASHSGKSTLAAALMHSGLSLFSDDSAAIERATGKVAAMPFALMLREGSWPVLQSRFPELLDAPAVLRYGQNVRFLSPVIAEPEAASASVKSLVFIEFKPGAKTTLVTVGGFERLLLLQESGFWVPHDRESIADFLAWIASLPSYSLTYSDLNEAVKVIRELIDAEA